MQQLDIKEWMTAAAVVQDILGRVIDAMDLADITNEGIDAYTIERMAEAAIAEIGKPIDASVEALSGD